MRLDSQFGPLHEALWDKALVGFRWRDGVGRVQETRFSDGSRLVANFGHSSIMIDGHKLPGRQLLVAQDKPVSVLKIRAEPGRHQEGSPRWPGRAAMHGG